MSVRTIVIALVGALVLTAPVLGAKAPALEVEVDQKFGLGWAVEVLEVDQVASAPGMIFRIENVSGTHLATAQISVTLERADGTVRSYAHLAVTTGLEPGESAHFSRTLPFSRIEPGDRLVVTPERLTPLRRQERIFEKSIGSVACTNYCDRCADRAAALCLHGTESYSCSCKEAEYRCDFTCNIPSV